MTDYSQMPQIAEGFGPIPPEYKLRGDGDIAALTFDDGFYVTCKQASLTPSKVHDMAHMLAHKRFENEYPGRLNDLIIRKATSLSLGEPLSSTEQAMWDRHQELFNW